MNKLYNKQMLDLKKYLFVGKHEKMVNLEVIML